ncbi:K02A2.6-like [Cordylochernes scorpioides]|uniref:RNA-directed DNA polymerase n=1 Tax=Cordylochernes scorpioides TaxID=51811 RepID=A0ABY6K9E2_9ARAC|nr:K02A2.6-like [Cordylochernes scorpioides]
MSAILRGINGVICHMDDILIFAKRKEEHDETLREVLRRPKNSGITLNKEKCQFGVSNVTFLGHYIDEHGIKADETKVKAIAEMKPPADLHWVQGFMGMVNFLGRFVPNLSEITKPLNDLRKKDASFIWGSPHKKAFEKVKDLLASDRVLASFEISKKTMVSADASSYGLVAVLKQENEANKWRPVAFASRTLTKTEQGYAQIEKEALAITWAYHKPLVPIFTTEDLNDLTPRLQRSRMRMLQFSFHIFHTPGKDLITADALSRQPLPGHLPEDEKLQEEVEHFVPLNQKLAPTIQKVVFYFENGWPAKCQLSPLESSFYDVRDEIGEENGSLMRGLQVIIPSNMRKYVLNRIHASHQGITKCRARRKDHVRWPGIGKEIQDMKEPLIPNDYPERPWQKVGMDLFHYEGTEYLVVADYLSRFIEVVRLRFRRKLWWEEEQRKMAQKTAFDRRHAARKKAELIAEEKVWVKDLRAWGSVIEKASTPRSYIGETPVGTYRRNSLLLAFSQQQVDPSETSPDSQLPAKTEETPGNELPAEELQQQTAIALGDEAAVSLIWEIVAIHGHLARGEHLSEQRSYGSATPIYVGQRLVVRPTGGTAGTPRGRMVRMGEARYIHEWGPTDANSSTGCSSSRAEFRAWMEKWVMGLDDPRRTMVSASCSAWNLLSPLRCKVFRLAWCRATWLRSRILDVTLQELSSFLILGESMTPGAGGFSHD